MDLSNDILQIGNYIKDYEGKIWKVSSLDETSLIIVRDIKGLEITLDLKYLLPIKINKDIIEKTGLKQVQEPSKEIFHHIYKYEIKINGKSYLLNIMEYQNSSLISFNRFTIRYLHELQNIVKLIDQSYQFNISD